MSIIALLAGIVMAAAGSARDRARSAVVVTDLGSVATQAELSNEATGDFSTVCSDAAGMVSAIGRITGVGASCYSYNSPGHSDVYLRWATSAMVYSATPLRAWSTSQAGNVTWDAQGVNASGVFVTPDVSMTWANANAACAAAGARLPTIEELDTLANATYMSSGNVTGNPVGFMWGGTWSSTTVPSTPTSAYFVAMDNGGGGSINTNLKANYLSVRCVR